MLHTDFAAILTRIATLMRKHITEVVGKLSEHQNEEKKASK